MKIEILEPQDRDRLEAFLIPWVDSSIILLSNVRQGGLVDRGQRFEGTYFAATRSGRIVGVVGHFWQGNLVFQAPEGLVEILAAVTEAAVRPVCGLLGPAGQVKAAKALLGCTDAQIKIDEVESLYALQLEDLMIPEDLRTGRLSGRRIEPRDLDQAVEWRLAYHLEALGSEESPALRATSHADMAASLERGDTWFLMHGGRPVAQTSFNAVFDDIVQVGGVWTPPELRGNGYGRCAVAVSLLDARSEGASRSILFTGDDNLGARKAYAALGYQPIGDYRIVLLRSSPCQSS